MTLNERLETGSLGFFWNLNEGAPDLESHPERGYAKTDRGWVIVDVLDEDPVNSLQTLGLDRRPEPPRALVAVMPEEAALFLEVQGPGITNRFGGARASSKRYFARTVIGSVPVDRLRTPSLEGLHAYFHGIGRWAGMSATQETWRHDDDGRVQGWSATLGGSDDFSHPLSGGRTLLLSTTWRVDGPTDKRTISAPVSMGCESRKPVDVWELLHPMLLVQDLLGFAFGGFVAADGGSAGLDLEPPTDKRSDSRPSLWNGALMVPAPAAPTPKSMNEFPLFHLATIGGIAGLTRWVRLSADHPRATGPVVAQYRFGPGSAPIRLMEIAAAVEYWVKANRPTPWADSAVKHKRWVQALANRCGAPFSSWVGDPEAWAKAFWGVYNHLKHDPADAPDSMELAELAESARYLLGAVILDRVAGSKAPSRAIFRHHRLDGLGVRLRDRYT